MSSSNNNNNNNNNNHEVSESSEDVLQVKFLSPNAIMPTRGSHHAAGFDLSASEATVVPAGGRVVVKTDLSIACPVGTYARIAPRR
jgi:dUTPase